MRNGNLVRQPDQFEIDHPWPDQAEVPRLHKFTRLDQEHPYRLQCLLQQAQLYHALPLELNDPWECRPWVSLPSTPAGLQRMRRRLIQTYPANLPQREKQRAVSEMMANRHKLLDALQADVEELYGSVRLCSLCAERDNLLLWAHYADAHHGICLEFDATRSCFPLAYRVNYQSDHPEVEYPMPRDRSALKQLLTKSQDWSYEVEFRSLINPEHLPPFANDGTFADLAADALIGVYFGIRTTEEDKDRIRAWIDWSF